ncbi:MAG TPA: hypothetical protein VKV04_20615 [Verrucomicrobiae bacterium]|nr:hypothetical protein [Verrucomicrobiae bacterium]
MSSSHQKGRSLLWLAAALLFASSVAIAIGVIPITGIYNSSYIGPGAMMIMCWSCLVFSGVAATILACVAACARKLSLSLGILLATVMVVALLFSFGLTDAAFAFDSRGPALQTPALFLHFCSGADFVVALLIVVAVVLLPKRTSGTPTSSLS